MKLWLLNRKIHKWIAWIVGLQILLWIAGGVVMSSFPLDAVRGTRWQTPHTTPNWSQAKISPAQIIATQPELASAHWHFAHRGNDIIYIVQHEKNKSVYSAHNGEKLTAYSEHDAIQTARNDFSGDYTTATALYLEQAGIEYREKPLPAWQIQLDDFWQTRIYVDALTGEITARRNQIWRVYDFFWMLHIMDYSERDNFNHPLLIGAASLAIFIAITGIIILIQSVRRRRT